MNVVKTLHDTTIHKLLTNSEPLIPQEYHESLAEEPRTLVEEPRKPHEPRLKVPWIKLRYLGINERPEEARPPVVYGKIDGRITRIMLDSGCSTYVLSTDFTSEGDIPCFPCKPICVELAVWNAGQFNLHTQTKKLPMEIGTIMQTKASYVLPLLRYDAIFGMPFLNGRKFITVKELPRDFLKHDLTASEFEDILCIFKDDFNQPFSSAWQKAGRPC